MEPQKSIGNVMPALVVTCTCPVSTRSLKLVMKHCASTTPATVIAAATISDLTSCSGGRWPRMSVQYGTPS